MAAVAALGLVAAAVTVVVAEGGSPAAAANCQTFWVAPTGKKSGNGSQGNPWASIEQARDHIRAKHLSRNLKCDITVNVKAGDYPVSSTITLDQRDSGSNGHQIVYRAVDGPGTARLVGGEEITGWQPYKDGIFKAKVDLGQPFNTMFVNGERATTARYPNRRSESEWAPYLVSTLGKKENEALRYRVGFNRGDWDPAWDLRLNTSWPAQVGIWSGGGWSWFTDTVPISQVDWNGNQAILQYWTRYAMMNSASGSRYFIQNSLSLLDQPGEYYLDYEAGEVYYMPAGGSMDGLTVTRPTVTRTITIAGASPENRAHDIVLDGLGVQYTDYMQWYRLGWINDGDSGVVHKYPQYDRQIEMPRFRFGAITLTNTRNIKLTRMHLEQTGYHAIYMLFANENDTVSDSLLEHIGGDGIKVEGGWPGEGDLTNHHTFTNNYIYHIGELVPGDAAGVELMGTGDNTVSHIVVKHSARYGISLESRPEVIDGEQYTDGNHFSYIRLEETGLDSVDMGAFYAYGVDNQEPHPVQNTVEQMVITDVIPDASAQKLGLTRGVHMDAGGCGFSYTDIQVGKTTDQEYQSYDCNEVVNATWEDDFDSSRMQYDQIGVLPSFPYDIPQK